MARDRQCDPLSIELGLPGQAPASDRPLQGWRAEANKLQSNDVREKSNHSPEPFPLSLSSVSQKSRSDDKRTREVRAPSAPGQCRMQTGRIRSARVHIISTKYCRVGRCFSAVMSSSVDRGRMLPVRRGGCPTYPVSTALYNIQAREQLEEIHQISLKYHLFLTLHDHFFLLFLRTVHDALFILRRRPSRCLRCCGPPHRSQQ